MKKSGIILCGGLSSRMGRAKALLPWQGRTMLAHVATRLSAVVDEVVVVTSRELDLEAAGLQDLAVTVAVDREPRLGPLGGIREGLAAMTGELAFVTATDAPYLTEGFVRTMLSFGGAAAFEQDGFVQSISAAYPKAGLEIAESLIAEQRMRPLFLLEELDYRKVTKDEVPDTESVRGFNKPEAYLSALPAGAEDVTIELLGLARSRTGRESVSAVTGHLRDVLAVVADVDLVREGNVAENFLVSLNGVQFLRDGDIPIGPGEHLIIMDAAVGG